MPLRLIAAENIAVLFLRHDRKGGGEVGQSGRGSSSASGEADHIVHLQRKAGQGDTSLRQRELDGVGRLVGMTGKLIVELTDAGHFNWWASKADVVMVRAKDHVLRVLPACTRRRLDDRGASRGSRLLAEHAEPSDRGALPRGSNQCREGGRSRERGEEREGQGFWRLPPCAQGALDLEES